MQIYNRMLSVLLMLLLCGAAIGETPEFALEESAAEYTISETLIIDGHTTGLIVPNNMLGSEFEATVPAAKADSLPSMFDWRDHNGVTPVKNQGNCSSCYAFATLAAVEGYVLSQHSGTTYDFSEEQSKECIWEALNYPGQYGGCSGGWAHWVINLITREGVVLEEDDPYHEYDTSCNASNVPVGRVTDWYFLTGYGPPYPDTLRQYVYDNGPVYTALDANCLYGYDGGVIPEHGFREINHAVVIVGWNDSGGYWICKNSFGEDWGEDGYFRIEYGANMVGSYSSVIGGYEDCDLDTYTLSYDEAGFQSAGGFGQHTGSYCLCVFDIDDEKITDIEFWTKDAVSDVDLYLYDEFNGTHLGTLLYTDEDMSFAEIGYHSADVSKMVISDTGSIVVVAYINNSDAPYPTVIDNAGPVETEKTYVSLDGSDNSWICMTEGDVALRLRASSETVAICGDVDGNGYVSANDVVEAYMRAVDPDYPLINEWGADADGNGYVSANDVVEIYLTAVDPSHPLNCIPIT